MVVNTWSEVLVASFQDLWRGVAAFVPNLIIAILIVIIGWALGSLIGRIVSQVFKSIRVDDALRKAGVDELVNRGGVNLNSGNFVGGLVKWFIIIVFLIAAFDVLGLSQVTLFLQQVALVYLPQVIVAVLVLLVAGVLGDVMQKVVVTSAMTAEIKSAGLLGSITKWSIWVFAILVALSQLGIAAGFIQTLFTGFVIALALGVGLSFGLGGQEAASKMIEKVSNEIKGHHH